MTIDSAIFTLVGGLAILGGLAYFLAHRAATGIRVGGGRMHSQPQQYGTLAAMIVVVPALALALILGIMALALDNTIPAVWTVGISLILAAILLTLSRTVVKPEVRARTLSEKIIKSLLFTAALISVAATAGIVLSIVFEAIIFFDIVSVFDFLTATTWNPDYSTGADDVDGYFGSVPLFAGSFMITFIALVVAIPVGLGSAIFMSQYASGPVRKICKPLLEILAGIPTVVYGVFAALTVSPLIVEAANTLGLDASYANALSPGIVMGIMIIPFISSLSDDVLTAVPSALRDGALALGLTRAETIWNIIVPAAYPGIISACVLAMSRALGETMIVVLAAGLRPNLTWNPLEDMTTVTVRIVDALTGDQAFNSPETLAAFGLGLVLFIITLALNLFAIITVRRFRKRYGE